MPVNASFFERFEGATRFSSSDFPFDCPYYPSVFRGAFTAPLAIALS